MNAVIELEEAYNRYKNDPEKEMKVLLKRRFSSIMVPYFWFSFFYLLVVLYALISGSVKPQTFFLQIWYVLGMYGMNVLWFLPALFGGEILFLWIRKKCSGKITSLVILLLTAAATVALLCFREFYSGAVFGERMEEVVITLLRPVFAAAFIAVGYFLFGLMKKQDGYLASSLLTGALLLALNLFTFRYNGGVDFRSLVQNNIALYYLCAVSGSMGVILLCKNLPAARCVTFWGVNSLIVMAVHNNETVLYYGMKLAMLLNRYLTHARGYICYLTVVVVISLYVTLMILLINRFFGFIVSKPSFLDKWIDKYRKGKP